jgi:hypothetical protein
MRDILSRPSSLESEWRILERKGMRGREQIEREGERGE